MNWYQTNLFEMSAISKMVFKYRFLFIRLCYQYYWTFSDYVYRKKPAFTAYLDGSFQGNGAIILPYVYSNMGSLYDPTTGIFTADQEGNYAFYVGLECEGKGLKIVELVKDGNKIAHATCYPKDIGDPDDTDIYYGSTFCVHHLDMGSKVWIKDTRHEHIIVGGKTTLSGFLL